MSLSSALVRNELYALIWCRLVVIDFTRLALEAWMCSRPYLVSVDIQDPPVLLNLHTN